MALMKSERDVGLPRAQAGASPQHLIVTLLGSYWFGCEGALPSAAVVALTEDFGVSSTSARAALSRLARRGLLESSKRGRNTFYRLTPQAAGVLRDDLGRVIRLGVDVRPWDGSWVVVMFSLPEDRRDVRHLLRSSLRWQGFAPLFDGAWVAPRAEIARTTGVLNELGIDNFTVLEAQIGDAGGEGDPLSAWNLAGLAELYRSFIAEFAEARQRVAQGAVSAAEALVLRGRVLDAWSEFVALDPDLPIDVLPSGWPRSQARETFTDLYDGLGPLAALRFEQVLGQHSPDIETPMYFTTSDERLLTPEHD